MRPFLASLSECLYLPKGEQSSEPAVQVIDDIKEETASAGQPRDVGWGSEREQTRQIKIDGLGNRRRAKRPRLFGGAAGEVF
ncbi:hypothetical protein EYF80_022381 [Liparis tanakae]|uniref:Uncharacterized protein n=1 Tax=Liparis tanakae TaxID=230148 RepID=A0A4Z2HQ92_9TELE|nr:hypothetical protein EYF80_022381 [Liparis tanakae]